MLGIITIKYNTFIVPWFNISEIKSYSVINSSARKENENKSFGWTFRNNYILGSLQIVHNWKLELCYNKLSDGKLVEIGPRKKIFVCNQWGLHLNKFE